MRKRKTTIGCIITILFTVLLLLNTNRNVNNMDSVRDNNNCECLYVTYDSEGTQDDISDYDDSEIL